MMLEISEVGGIRGYWDLVGEVVSVVAASTWVGGGGFGLVFGGAVVNGSRMVMWDRSLTPSRAEPPTYGFAYRHFSGNKTSISTSSSSFVCVFHLGTEEESISAMDIDGLAGGPALLWDDSITVKIWKVDILLMQMAETYNLGHSMFLVGGSSDRWVVIGDFNEILRLSEKSRGCIRNQSQMDAVCQALLDCNLDDIGAAGAAYTWVDSTTKERLDRAVCSLAWLESFAHSQVINVHPSRSDHLPLLLEVRKERAVHHKFKRDYRFEEMCVSHEGFSMAVEAAWSIPQVGAHMV
ncbi:hypothetical protein ACLB2K_066279 [Fragaria x ananassa]